MSYKLKYMFSMFILEGLPYYQNEQSSSIVS